MQDIFLQQIRKFCKTNQTKTFLIEKQNPKQKNNNNMYKNNNNNKTPNQITRVSENTIT